MVNIESRRKALGMTQSQLADSLGVERSTVTKWESGKAAPRVDMLKALAEKLECTVDELIG